MTGTPPSFRRPARALWWLGGAAMAFGLFLRITRELMEGDVSAGDNAILRAVENARTPWLTSAALDITALGSITLVVLFSFLAFLLLFALRDRRGALQLLIASVGAAGLTMLTKAFVERVRPPEAQQLIVVSGFSYPSGHATSTAALYLTIAIVASRYVKDAGARMVLFLAVSVILILVGASRIYLGVHFATDVASGISLGAAWALLLAGCFTRLGQRGSTALPVAAAQPPARELP